MKTVSFIKNGSIVHQTDIADEGRRLEVKTGECDVGEIARTLIFDLEKGEGVRIIEYAIGGMSREEIAARIKKLEAEVRELRKSKK